jgi:hypothetical protein
VSRQKVFLVLAIVAGVLSGPWALEGAAASNPPVDWGGLAFMCVGSVFALPSVLGIQVAVRNNKCLQMGWSFFLLASTYMMASGLSALALSVVRGNVGPHSFLIAGASIASFAGLAISKTIYARRFSDDA